MGKSNGKDTGAGLVTVAPMAKASRPINRPPETIVRDGPELRRSVRIPGSQVKTPRATSAIRPSSPLSAPPTVSKPARVLEQRAKSSAVASSARQNNVAQVVRVEAAEKQLPAGAVAKKPPRANQLPPSSPIRSGTTTPIRTGPEKGKNRALPPSRTPSPAPRANARPLQSTRIEDAPAKGPVPFFPQRASRVYGKPDTEVAATDRPAAPTRDDRVPIPAKSILKKHTEKPRYEELEDEDVQELEVLLRKSPRFRGTHKKPVFDDDDESSSHVSQSDYADEAQRTPFVPLFKDADRNRRRFLDNDTLQRYDPNEALFQWQAEDDLDARNVMAAAGSRRRERSRSPTPSQSHATKRRKYNLSPERSQPRDVLSAHQAARSGKEKDVQKKPAKSTESRAQQAISSNPVKSKGIPDIREVQRAAADRERELNVRNNDTRKGRNDPGEVRFDDGDNDFYAYGQQDEEDQVDRDESAALDVPKSRRSRKRKKKHPKRAEEAPRPASPTSPDTASDSTDSDSPLTHIGAYTPRSQVLLKHTKLGFRERIYTINPFPSDALRTQFGQEAWQEATEKYASTFLKAHLKEFDKYVLRIAGDMAWVSRGVMVRRAKALVVDHYDLRPPNRSIVSLGKSHDGDIKFIKNRVAALLDEDHSYMKATFGKHRNGTPRERVPFAHTALVDVIWLGCYSPTDRADRGIYDPMPLPIVVLAATCLYAALHAWSDGYYVKRKFTEEVYAPVYRTLLQTALEFQRESKVRCTALMKSYTAAMIAYSDGAPEPVLPLDKPIKIREANDTEDDEEYE